MKARGIAQAGILIALQIITLLLVYVIPTIKLALLFAASLYPGVLLRIGVSRRNILVSFFAAAVLAVFLVQIPEMQVAFAAFFGWYGIIHESTRDMGMAKQQLIRWAGFLASALTAYLAFTYIVSVEINYALWLMAAAGAAAFILMQFLYEFTVREFVKRSKIKLSEGKITFR